MSLPTTVTLVYTILPVPPVTNTRLALAVEAVGLSHTDLANFGATYVSDTTAQPTDASVTRTLVFHLSAAFFKNFNFAAGSTPDPNKIFAGMFANFYTHTLGAALGSVVTAAAPAFT